MRPGEKGRGVHGFGLLASWALLHDEVGRHPESSTFPPLPASTGTMP